LDKALYFNGNDSSWYQTSHMSNSKDVLWAVRNYTEYNDVLWACRDIQDSATAAACLAFTNTSNLTIASGTNYGAAQKGYSTTPYSTSTTTTTTTTTTGQGEGSGQGFGGRVYNKDTGVRDQSTGYQNSGTSILKCPDSARTFTIGGLLETSGESTVLLFVAVNGTNVQDFNTLLAQAQSGQGVFGNATINDATLTSAIHNLTSGESLVGVANVTFGQNPCYIPPSTLIQEALSSNAQVENPSGNLTSVASAFESLSGSSVNKWTSGANYSYNGTWTGTNFVSNLTNGSIPAIGTVGNGSKCGPLVGNPICGPGYCCSRTSYLCESSSNSTDCLYY